MSAPERHKVREAGRNRAHWHVMSAREFAATYWDLERPIVALCGKQIGAAGAEIVTEPLDYLTCGECFKRSKDLPR